MSSTKVSVAGVDIGGTNIKAVGAAGTHDVDGGLELGRSASRQTGALDPPDIVLDRVAAAVEQVSDGTPAVVGVALPGNVDAAAGTPLYVPALGADWEGHKVGERLGDLLGARVVLLNDVHAMTRAELTMGAAKGATDALCVAIGTGVGGGLVLGGQLHIGPSGTAGALGHTTVEPDGPVCVCGNQGCLEVYASGPAIARQSGRPTAAAAAAAAREGDRDALAAFTRAGRYLGSAIANVITMVTPSRVVVGGGVGAAGELLLEPLRTELRRRVRVVPLSGTRVLPAACGDEAGALGAALAALANPRDGHDAPDAEQAEQAEQVRM